MITEELLAKHDIKLESTKPGRHYTTCPQCSAKRGREHQSSKCLGVTIDAKGIRWGCNHCGWTGPEKGSGEGRASSREPLTTHDYRDRDGVVRFRKVRNLPGRTPKCWFEHPDSKGEWLKGTGGADTKILYRLDDVAKAIEQGRIIAVVEGEKDADNVAALGITAACNSHGASEPGKRPKWMKVHSEQLAGADIVVLNDNDPAGYEHADATCKLSLGIAKRVRRLDLALHWPEIPKGGDVSDWLAAGHTREEFAALIAAAPDYVPLTTAEDAKPNGNGIDDNAELERLARLAPLDYERARKDAGKKLGISRLALLDALVKAKRAELGLDGDDGRQGHGISFSEPEPWPQPVDGAALLDDLAKAIRRHVVMLDTARDEAALWVVHAHMFDCFLVSPRLGVTSPVKGCGKTTLLDVLGRLVPRPLPTANVTPAALFRVVEGYQPTLLVDEADTFLHDNDELRGVLNSGHRKGGTVLRTVGDDHEPRAFKTFCPTVIALIGHLPDTLHDRAVSIELKRALRTETVEPFRPDRADCLDVLARKAARWAKDHAERMADADPQMPDGIINRMGDNWRPLLAIAEAAAGGGWPERARKAAEAARIAAADDEASRLELLLNDIRAVFADKLEMPSADLVAALIALDGRPWAELGRTRKPLTQNRLARLLKPLAIAPENIRVGDKIPKGYVLSRFKEAFDRYLPPSEPLHRYNADEMGTSEPFQSATPEADVAVVKCEKPTNDGHCSGVADAKGGNGQDASHLDEPGLSSRSIEELRKAYEERAYAHALANEGDTRTADCDAWLRRTLAESGVLPEAVEVEFRRVMDAVFAV